MNKAVTGVFSNSQAGQRAINDLKANGFGGETIVHLIRERLPADAPQGPRLWPAAELLKDIAIGALAGAILGAIGDWFVGMALTWPGFSFDNHLAAAVVTLAIAGAIVGVLTGLAAEGTLAPVRHALLTHRSEDAIVSVYTDETHAGQAMDLLRKAGARHVRRGATSVAGEYRMVEGVRPEAYDTAEPGAIGEPVRPEGVRVESPQGHGDSAASA